MRYSHSLALGVLRSWGRRAVGSLLLPRNRLELVRSRTSALVATWFVLLLGLVCPSAAQMPADWKSLWQQPTLADRPLQIVHALGPQMVAADAVAQILQQFAQQPQTDEGLAYYLRRGRGGLVCNVNFQNYLTSEDHWKTLIQAVADCARLGMPVWIYDEKGYPSGAAGGLVLQDHPDLEALVLARDPTGKPEFFLRRAFEHTHAAHNYHAVRRYPNLLDGRAAARFIQLTHQAYYTRLKEHFGKTIVAFFTDEPSLMAVDLGPIPEPAGSKVPVQDKPDPNVPKLPTVPWCDDLEAVYRQRWQEELKPHVKSLFEGDQPDDRRIRRQFWATIADLLADRYFGQLQQWCQQHGVASSGHNLAEETILLHVPLYGNGLKAIARMDIPGLDLLTSDPDSVQQSVHWMTTAMPVSAALLEGRRCVMTEVSDFTQKMFGSGPVGLAQMQAVAGWQAAWGVTEFTLYYHPADRSVEENWQYGQFVGRLNSILKPALPKPEVALYYPIYDLWAEYRPVAGLWRNWPGTPKSQQVIGSFYRLGQSLHQRQIPFVLIDHEYLQKADVTEAGLLKIGSLELKTLLCPAGVQWPDGIQPRLEAFQQKGGRLLQDLPDRPISQANIQELLQPAVRLAPATSWLTLGRFTRDQHTIFILVNMGKQPYQGFLEGVPPGPWTQLDPATGKIEQIATAPQGLPIRLQPYQTLLWVH